MKNFISFEGIDGCGKTTQISLVSKYLDEKNISNSIIREPGDTKVSELIRKILLDKENKIFSNTESLLFLAARSQLVNEIILPKLKNNEFVLCDRYLDSTVAYQGFGHNLDLDLINRMNKFSTNNLFPSLTIIFDIDPKIAMKRIKINNLDRMESRSINYFNKVRDGYIKISKLYPERCTIIDCNGKDIMSVYKSVVKLIDLYL
jgi:dTMP kinase